MEADFDFFVLIMASIICLAIGFVIGVVMTSKAIDNFNKFCPECGRQYKAEAEYCSYDGSELRMIGEEE